MLIICFFYVVATLSGNINVQIYIFKVKHAKKIGILLF